MQLQRKQRRQLRERRRRDPDQLRRLLQREAREARAVPLPAFSGSPSPATALGVSRGRCRDEAQSHRARRAALAVGARRCPVRASASKGQWSIFEDHTALVQSGVQKRDRHAQPDQGPLGADTLRIEFRGRDRAGARREDEARLRRHRPARLPVRARRLTPASTRTTTSCAAPRMGFRIIITITGDAPRWATAAARAPASRPPTRLIASDYAQFAEAVASRYSGNFGGLPAIHYFSIWNEPNHKQFLKPHSEGARDLPPAGATGVPAIRKGGVSGAKVFVGETAPVRRRAASRSGPTSSCRSGSASTSAGRRSGAAAAAASRRSMREGYAHHPYGPPGRVLEQAGHGQHRRRSAGSASTSTRPRAPGASAEAPLDLQHRVRATSSNPPDQLVSTSPPGRRS